MHPDLREPWETLKNPTLTVTTCNQTFQHTAIVFHGFYLQAMSHKHEDVTDLMDREGEFWIESNKGSSSRFETTHLLSAPREVRFLAAGKLKELWIACGGDPERIKQPSSGV